MFEFGSSANLNAHNRLTTKSKISIPVSKQLKKRFNHKKKKNNQKNVLKSKKTNSTTIDPTTITFLDATIQKNQKERESHVQHPHLAWQ